MGSLRLSALAGKGLYHTVVLSGKRRALRKVPEGSLKKKLPSEVPAVASVAVEKLGGTAAEGLQLPVLGRRWSVICKV